MVADPFARESRAVPNLRDLGERQVAGGRLVAGRFYRSAEPTDPGAADELAALGITTVVDLRTAGEVTERRDRLPDGVAYHHCDVLADVPPQIAQGQAQLMSDPVAFTSAFGLFDPVVQMNRTYRDLVVAGAARAAYARALRAVVEADGAPVLLHCTAGKDRTGWVATVLLATAGVDDEAIETEYLAVNPAVRAMFVPLVEQYAAAGAPPQLLEPMLEVRIEYLRTALKHVADGFGGFDGYLHDGLGLTDDETAALRALLVQPI
ncbi:MAG: tyrosine-protein phosphatase [Micrococcales bacterium]|nr:tyrosine-protein phosphatase [Micrococcales bacterium]MCL2667484.1 tyrosine-protein phosphatase [Micrococcales bacterium]